MTPLRQEHPTTGPTVADAVDLADTLDRAARAELESCTSSDEEACWAALRHTLEALAELAGYEPAAALRGLQRAAEALGVGE